jgi:ArsR family transcriptional regulator, arsenate/arsenite/antimonite-responsive transcriptional repressor
MKRSDAVAALGALAQDSRLDVFRMLMAAGPDGLCAGAISTRLRMPSPTLSFHLSQLCHAGLTSARRAGRSIIYMANFRTMNALLAYLTQDCCGGRPEICLPAAGQPGRSQAQSCGEPARRRA